MENNDFWMSIITVQIAIQALLLYSINDNLKDIKEFIRRILDNTNRIKEREIDSNKKHNGTNNTKESKDA